MKLFQKRRDNHGCFGETVVVDFQEQSWSKEETAFGWYGVVVSVEKCSSCWQTGCNGPDSSKFEEGDTVFLDARKVPHGWDLKACEVCLSDLVEAWEPGDQDGSIIQPDDLTVIRQ
ncbi:hypothetical protein KKG24_04330 [Patescibacteria group bacterium]|nr:hypothetical protein [Patescibacteria group bacterium]